MDWISVSKHTIEKKKKALNLSETFYLHEFFMILSTWWCLMKEEFPLQLFELTGEIHLDLCDAHFHPLLRCLFLFPLQQVLYDSWKRKLPIWCIESLPAKHTATVVPSHWWGWRLESESNHPVFKTWEVIRTQARKSRLSLCLTHQVSEDASCWAGVKSGIYSYNHQFCQICGE